jgi:hypothetical protein
MNRGLEDFRSANIAVDINNLPSGVTKDVNTSFDRKTVPLVVSDNKSAPTQPTSVEGMTLLNSINSAVIPDGKYLYNPQSGKIEIQWVQGIGSERAAAPQARLMATVINGILTRKLPWGLILLGVFLVIGVELLGIRSLSFAVGFYLSIATTLAIFAGGVVRWLVERSAARAGEHVEESEVSPGSLYASGLIAAGGIVGLIGIAIKLMEAQGWMKEGAIAWGSRIPVLQGDFGTGLAVATFALLAFSLYHFARKPLGGNGR